MKTIAIYGLGLIGGSFGLALRKAGFEGEILGLCAPPYAEKALEMGAITTVASDFDEIARRADVIYLSHKVDAILAAMPVLGPIARPGCFITDTGSTKTAIVSEATKHIKSAVFVGGHPMAGKETRGIEAADPDLFRDRPYVLTSQCDSSHMETFVSWLNRIGAHVTYLTPEEHDRTVAYTSHLPQLLSTALAVTLTKERDEVISKVFGPGLTDMTRLALSASDLWTSILVTNKNAVRQAIGAFTETLGEMTKALEKESLDTLLTEGAEFAAKLRKAKPPE